jgi:hypothetical protein
MVHEDMNTNLPDARHSCARLARVTGPLWYRAHQRVGQRDDPQPGCAYARACDIARACPRAHFKIGKGNIALHDPTLPLRNGVGDRAVTLPDPYGLDSAAGRRLAGAAWTRPWSVDERQERARHSDSPLRACCGWRSRSGDCRRSSAGFSTGKVALGLVGGRPDPQVLLLGRGEDDHEIVRRDDHAVLAEGAVTVKPVA